MAGLITFLESKMLSKYSVVLFVSFVYLIGSPKSHHERPLVSCEQLLNSASNDFYYLLETYRRGLATQKRLARTKLAVEVTNCVDIRKRNVELAAVELRCRGRMWTICSFEFAKAPLECLLLGSWVSRIN